MVADVTAVFAPHDALGAESPKRHQIIEGARQVFLRDGFDGASMNDITRAAGVSKGTVYAYFPSKAALFEALIREDRRIQAEQICRYSADDENVVEVLRELAQNIVAAVTQPVHIAHLRTVLAAAAKFPAIGHAFYEAGPMYGAARLAEYLDRQVSAGRLSIDDTNRAAFQFIDLCLARPLKQMLFGVIDAPDPAEMDKAIDSAIAMFMASYGRRG